MLVVAGLSLKNLRPRVWDPASQFYLPKLRAIMVSYADFYQLPSMRRAAMKVGIREWLSVPDSVQVYLDNGAFYFLGRKGPDHFGGYEEFVASTGANWWPIPQDYIPTPHMDARAQRACFRKTMDVNRSYQADGFVPVVHVGRQLKNYLSAVTECDALVAKERIAIGGIVPNLLRAPKAIPYSDIIAGLKSARAAFRTQDVHIFGVGGTSTLHLAGVLGFNSADSAGWRNRAARGIIQLPGSGDRVVAELGSWRGRRPSEDEWLRLKHCPCPACDGFGVAKLVATGIEGFERRAAHNLFVLLEEAEWIDKELAAGTYAKNYEDRLDNSIYLRHVKTALEINGEATRI